MWSLGTDSALFLLIASAIALAAFVVALIVTWTNRSDVVVRQAAKLSSSIAVAVGLVGVTYWELTDNAARPYSAALVIFVVLAIPTFVISFYGYSSWLRRATGTRSR